MDASQIQVGDVVLLGDRDGFWADCLLLVEEIRPWGVVGIVRGPKRSDYPLRVPYDGIDAVYRRIEADA